MSSRNPSSPSAPASSSPASRPGDTVGAALSPFGWPVVERGLLMAHVGRVLFIYNDDRLSDDGLDRLLLELGRAIDARGIPVGVVHHVPSVGALNARRRKAVAEFLHARKDALKRSTLAYALVTESAIVRGILQAVFWLAPPPYPYEVCATVTEALTLLRRYMGVVDEIMLLREYDALRARLLLLR